MKEECRGNDSPHHVVVANIKFLCKCRTIHMFFGKATSLFLSTILSTSTTTRYLATAPTALHRVGLHLHSCNNITNINNNGSTGESSAVMVDGGGAINCLPPAWVSTNASLEKDYRPTRDYLQYH